MKEEVERLLKERDLLLNDTKKHNNILEEKTALITEQYETIIKEKNEKLWKVSTNYKVTLCPTKPIAKYWGNPKFLFAGFSWKNLNWRQEKNLVN